MVELICFFTLALTAINCVVASMQTAQIAKLERHIKGEV